MIFNLKKRNIDNLKQLFKKFNLKKRNKDNLNQLHYEFLIKINKKLNILIYFLFFAGKTSNLCLWPYL